MKKINFVLPPNFDKAIGGYKIVYQYANELAKREYEVSITHVFGFGNRPISKILRFIAGNTNYYKTLKKEITWFSLDSRVKLFFDAISPSEFPDSDYVIATSMETTNIVAKLPEKSGDKYYFIQDYEAERFGHSKAEVEKTYKLGFKNIVISNELKEVVFKASGIEPSYLPNFYDPEEFYLSRPIEKRNNKVALINHKHETKRTKFGLEILKDVRKEIPDLEVELFGAYDPVCDLESYVNFTYKADSESLRNEIYGKSKIYLLPSIREGWVLTGMEAMASGAVVVASRIGGIVDYANNENSILVTPDDKKEFIKKIISLLNDDELRIKFANQALTDVQKYRVEDSCDILENILNSSKQP